MYRKTQFWAAVLIALGAGFILSSMFVSLVLQLIVGIVLVTIGFLIERQC